MEFLIGMAGFGSVSALLRLDERATVLLGCVTFCGCFWASVGRLVG